MEKSGYVNGSDMLLYINNKVFGQCTSHTTTYNSETKDHAVKPSAALGVYAGKWKGKSVTGLSISISADGLRFYEEDETGFKTLLKMWYEGAPVQVKCCERGESDGWTPDPYLVGNFVITSLEESDPAQDEATYKVTLENDGIPDNFKPSKLEGETFTENPNSGPEGSPTGGGSGPD